MLNILPRFAGLRGYDKFDFCTFKKPESQIKLPVMKGGDVMNVKKLDVI